MKAKTSQLALVFLSILLFIDDGLACSTFVLKRGGGQVFGRNYDWRIDDALLVVNKRGCSKRSITRPFEKGRKATWNAKYGSITFNQWGRELPTGGMNEVGLVVEAMALSETRYPKPDDRPYVGAATQWRQYLLDTCATVAEVIDTDRKVRISNRAPGLGIHILVLDKNGDSAVIEFLDGRMKVHTGNDLSMAVLTNDTYAESLDCLRNNSPPMFESTNSITRFITVAEKNRKCKAQNIDELVSFAFDTLAAVSMARTQWRIVYDNINMMVYFRTRTNKKIRYIDVSSFDFTPTTPVKVIDMNADLSGDITETFSDYTYTANRDLIGRVYGKTQSLSWVTEEQMDLLARFPESFECR